MEKKVFTREIRLTEDGSKTIYIPELDENYHSFHGALQEARHVFIQRGFRAIDKQEFAILEIGFGTGLNALLTALEAESNNKKIHYHGLEAYPVETDLLAQMDYCSVIDSPKCEDLFTAIHRAPFDKTCPINIHFELTKVHALLEDYYPKAQQFDLIYFDAFGPRAQEDMWSIAHFKKLFVSLKPGGILVTYCAKGQVKRDLKSVGFHIESLTGPPGKREMTRGGK
jgi:tRNA U34 5-methylaminomethyl-2-thiouridine-forming methyltransferase MnmC